MELEHDLSSVGRLASAIASYQMESQSGIIREINKILCEVLSKAVSVRERYLDLFDGLHQDVQ